MKNRFIKILSVLGMSALLLVNGNVLFTAHAHEHFKREPGDPEVGGGTNGYKMTLYNQCFMCLPDIGSCEVPAQCCIFNEPFC